MQLLRAIRRTAMRCNAVFSHAAHFFHRKRRGTGRLPWRLIPPLFAGGYACLLRQPKTAVLKTHPSRCPRSKAGFGSEQPEPPSQGTVSFLQAKKAGQCRCRSLWGMLQAVRYARVVGRKPVFLISAMDVHPPLCPNGPALRLHLSPPESFHDIFPCAMQRAGSICPHNFLYPPKSRLPSKRLLT